MNAEQELTTSIEQEQHTATPQVQILDDHFYSPELQAQRRVWLYLPADYETSGKSYPVIYMQDGQNLFDQYTASYQEWGVDEIMDELFAGQACIIVAVDHGEENRITEYNPYDSEHGQGKGDDYVSFLTGTLKPYIDQQYRTLTDTKHTAIAGSSMGGLIAMYAALKCPEVFGNAGVFSPAFWIAKEVYAYALQQENLNNSRFYFVCGDAESDDMVGDMIGMADIVSEKVTDKQQVMVQVVPGAGHNEQQWHDDFPAFYEWLMAGF
ncbi:alpha/beta hydrolase [Mucilaginibacter robiniae]|uniref:Alpha/beta hydrolase n=1 Tax=Mucilaginibacter robiniae TaxID=2728022 RepID=A0A7L5DWU7_9SPHI|nr:alpha/beta hydrolase-fold protein [Mucilaginibacter robiniae]QJD94459.1 alpha/beta hydrolase [Mucilaginibacter robiniae]